MAIDPDARTEKLTDLTKRQLLELAKELSITGRHKMPKRDLVAAILEEEKMKTAAEEKKAQETETREKKSPTSPSSPFGPFESEEERLQEQEAEESKYVLGTEPPPEEFPQGKPLPQEYGEDRLTLLVRDPFWGYVYWEITPAAYERAQGELGSGMEGARSILRVYDLSSGNLEHSFDIDVPGSSRSWYVNFGKPGGTFRVDYGLITQDGRFYALAQSNHVTLPALGPSDVVDEKWVTVQEEFERFYALSGGFQPGMSSGELREQIQLRMQEQIGSGGVSSISSPMHRRRQEQERGFRFEVDTELIVYGSTEPDATVTLQGKPIQLRPDGTFTLRFALPDGKQHIELTARSADNKEERTITPEVERKTHRPEPVVKD